MRPITSKEYMGLYRKAAVNKDFNLALRITKRRCITYGGIAEHKLWSKAIEDDMEQSISNKKNDISLCVFCEIRDKNHRIFKEGKEGCEFCPVRHICHDRYTLSVGQVYERLCNEAVKKECNKLTRKYGR